MPSSSTEGSPRALPERPVALRGSGVAALLLKLIGWRVLFQGLPAPQGVLVVYPHTSNWDFPILVLAKWAVGIQLTFWGKDTLFRWPLFGRWLRWLGGLPVARHRPQGAVGQMVEALREARAHARFMWLGLSPEGTRRLTEGWRSGFYRVTLQAQVPLGVVALDYGRREVRFQHFWQLGGLPDEDIAAIATALQGVRGKRPEQAAPIRLL